ncbi:MAG: hypothetical protein ACR2GC_00100 [Methyloceanibacter sp.]|uniref:hypothetical protein n=1 Tax=Methyloceanibacter sp. TaxID=1965321 RepID=UPI003D9B70DF
MEHLFWLSDEAWAAIKPHLPTNQPGARRNLRAVQLLLGHTKIQSTVRYLGIEVDAPRAVAEQIDV